MTRLWLQRGRAQPAGGGHKRAHGAGRAGGAGGLAGGQRRRLRAAHPPRAPPQPLTLLRTACRTLLALVMGVLIQVLEACSPSCTLSKSFQSRHVTGVLIHDPTPWSHGCVCCASQVVLSELDGLKKGMSERAVASREASRFLEDLAARDRQALRFARCGVDSQAHTGLQLVGVQSQLPDRVASVAVLRCVSATADALLPCGQRAGCSSTAAGTSRVLQMPAAMGG